MNNMNQPISNEPKKLTWLWSVLAIVVIFLGGYLIWQNINKNTPEAQTASPSPSVSPAADLNAVNTDLNNLDSDLSQLDKIDASEDNAPSL